MLQERRDVPDESLDLEHVHMTIPTDLLTAEELADRLRIRPDTVRTWSRRGLIPKVQLSRKVIRFDLKAVVDAMATRHGGKGADDE